MFKRVLLLLLLVAVLVVPGAAYVDFYDNFDDLSSEWTTFKKITGDDQTFCSDGILNLYTHSSSKMGYHYKVYPEPMDLPFTFHVRLKPTSNTASIQLLNQLGISSSDRARGYGVQILTEGTRFTVYDVRISGFVQKGSISFNPESEWVTLRVLVTEDKKLYVAADDGNYTYVYTVPSDAFYPAYGVIASGTGYTGMPKWAYYDWVAIDPDPDGPPIGFVPCTINVYDADTRLPLSGTWDYNVVVEGADAVSGSASGAFKALYLPPTSTLHPHLVYVTKEGYEMTPGVVAIDVPAGGRQIKIYMTPLDTVGQPGYRSGTVTMTDNNGTTITGFEVTAENANTGQSYTVATDTDVAVLNLPMDRTIQIRNPQTGEYEEAPVGYYRFYGQSSGYKMLYEDGIQVSVMPEKYGSYQLCDIRVTPESGYLTGTHQFQIRSRSDNSILQSGTISAKSATTGEWFNTTVTEGIASLILPYDTSNVQSQYAGNYYVYATSPGYEDSDYGTQIVVMPHTVSEIRDILLTPIGGIPTPGNVTLRIQAFSETGPGVRDAEIFIAGVLGEGSSLWDTYTASSTGYLTVSVPGNSTYDIVASGAGYYDSARRVEVFMEDPALIEIKLYLSGAPTLEPTTHPTGWPTDHPTTQPTGGIPDEDDDSEGFLMQAVRGIGLAFGVGFATAKLIFGMLLALSIGYATAKQLRGGAAEFGLGLLGGTLLGVLIGLLPVWIIVVLLLVVGLYIGNRYVGGANNG